MADRTSHIARAARAILQELEDAFTRLLRRMGMTPQARCLMGRMIALKSMERIPETAQMRGDYLKLTIMPLLATISETALNKNTK